MAEAKAAAKTKAKTSKIEESLGTGRRKTSSARVYLRPGGKGKFVVNDKPLEIYFPVEEKCRDIKSPFKAVGNEIGDFDILARVRGGGITGQAGAIRLGLARALLAFNEENKGALRKAGLLTRDARIVERKKVGLRKARKATQYSKR